MQSWYFGYVLAFALVLLVFFCVQMTKKRCSHVILWLPLLVMLFLLAAVLILREKTAESAELMASIYRSNQNAPPGMGVTTPPFEARDVALHFINTAGASRWLKHCPWYLLTTEIFALIAWLISRKLKVGAKICVSGVSFGIAALLLVMCLIDRHHALSARALFQKAEVLKEPASWVTVDELNDYTLYHIYIFWDEDCFLSGDVYSLKLSKNVAGYDEPGAFSEKLGVMRKDSPHTRPYLLLPTEKPGWFGGSNLWHVYDREINGLFSAGPPAFVRAEQLIRAAGSYRENGILGVIARPWLTSIDLGIYTLGIAVPPNIMHVFVPFEIYLLAPLTVLFAAVWLIMCIGQRAITRKE